MKALHALLESARTVLPPWALALLVLAAGWALAGTASLLLSRFLHVLRFNALAERLGLAAFLRKGAVHRPASGVAGRAAYWIILIATLFEVARELNVEAAEATLQRLRATLPGLVSALLSRTIGLLLVSFLANFVRTLARNAGSDYAELLGRATRWIGNLFVLLLALEQIELRMTLLAATLQFILAAAAFGVALAFGLGCKDLARHTAERWLASLRDRHPPTAPEDLEG